MLERKKSEEGVKLPFNKVMTHPPRILKLSMDHTNKKKKTKMNESLLDLPKKDCDLCILESTGVLPRS